jgi:hypothetical protein
MARDKQRTKGSSWPTVTSQSSRTCGITSRSWRFFRSSGRATTGKATRATPCTQWSTTPSAATARSGSSMRVVCSDGMTALHESLVGVDGKVVAHIDPCDPWAQGPAGVSAVGLARELIQRGVGLVYWNGYDGPEQRGWAFDELRESSSAAILWCGDVMVASHEKARTPRQRLAGLERPWRAWSYRNSTHRSGSPAAQVELQLDASGACLRVPSNAGTWRCQSPCSFHLSAAFACVWNGQYA